MTENQDTEAKKSKPRKSRKERGVKLLTIELANEDYQKTTKEANEMGMGITAYAREMVMKKQIVGRRTPDQQKMYKALCDVHKELSRQGNNLNQAVKALNTLQKNIDTAIPLNTNDIEKAIENIQKMTERLDQIWSIEEAKTMMPRKNK